MNRNGNKNRNTNPARSKALLIASSVAAASIAGLVTEPKARASSLRYRCSISQSGTDFPEANRRSEKSEITISTPLLGLWGGPEIHMYLLGRREGESPAIIPLKALYDSADQPGFKEFSRSGDQSMIGQDTVTYSFEKGLLNGAKTGKAHVIRAVSGEGGLNEMKYDLDCMKSGGPDAMNGSVQDRSSLQARSQGGVRSRPSAPWWRDLLASIDQYRREGQTLLDRLDDRLDADGHCNAPLLMTPPVSPGMAAADGAS